MNKYQIAAQQNVDQHLGDVVDGDDDVTVIMDEAFSLAYDGAIGAGADPNTATAIASSIANTVF